jgi:Tol biopolymer transport system component
MVYHRYTSYDALDSEMLLYDFKTDDLQLISKDWDISHAMNAHFSPDGKQITFMGIGTNRSWCIYLYDLVTQDHPALLVSGTSRDEDPKFSADGTKIIFKHNLRIAELVLATGSVTYISDASDEFSMPYYNYDGSQIVCAKGAGVNSSIVAFDIAAKTSRTLYNTPNVHEYYPINADETSFYYAAGFSATNLIDQIYRGFWNGAARVRLPFNGMDGDYSDPYPAGNEWLILSSTRP